MKSAISTEATFEASVVASVTAAVAADEAVVDPTGAVELGVVTVANVANVADVVGVVAIVAVEVEPDDEQAVAPRVNRHRAEMIVRGLTTSYSKPTA